MLGSVRACWHWIVLPGLLAFALLLLGAPQRAAAQSIDDGLVGYWRFDEGSGATSADSSGSGNTATLFTPNSFTASTASTDFANPFAFSSHPTATSYATAAGVNIDSLPQFTVAFWTRIDSLPEFLPTNLVALKNKVSFTSFRRDTVAVNLEFVNTAVEIRASMPVGDGAYHHIAATYDGKHIRLYVDGALRNTFDINDPTIVRPGPLALGQGVEFSNADFPLDGALDDARVYNRVLSGGEILALTYNCGGAQGLPASECRSLASLFRNTNGQDWTNHAGWLQNANPCTWAGVLCDNGHVFALSLPQNRLAGPLVTDLGNLPQLAVLNLADNQLTGAIPFELGNLLKLQTLGLSNNQLVLQLPFTLGKLTELRTLLLQNNQLRGPIPVQLANLTKLITFDLSYNMLSAFDPTLLNFLAAHQPGWDATQTVPPANLQAAAQTGTSVALTWDPIPYTADGGYYQVLVAPQATGVYTIAGVTDDKNANSFRVEGLTSGQTYSFLVRTYTPHHDTQQNNLLSDSTDPVTATPVTLPVSLPVTITIALDVQPDSRTNFVFTGTFGAFTLDDITPQDGDAFKASKTFVVPAGVYTVTETPITDYLDVNASCSPLQGPLLTWPTTRSSSMLPAEPT